MRLTSSSVVLFVSASCAVGRITSFGELGAVSLINRLRRSFSRESKTFHIDRV